jgi:N-acetylglucosaminyl-diphospho-decaprenol L-rhamnosyltransferase
VIGRPSGLAGEGSDGPRAVAPEVDQAVAAVVVNFQSGPALAHCVAQLREESPAELVVVDNGSSDGSLREVGDRFPDVEVVAPGSNLGYGAAANRGAAATTAPFLLVCNPDLDVHPGTLAALLASLVDDPGCALVGPLIRDAQGKRYPSARRFPNLIQAAGHGLLGIFLPDNPFTRAYHQSHLDGPDGAEGAGAKSETVDWVSGACFLVRRSAFEQVGGFDESYFMYAEDVDLCWRLGRVGWRVLYLPSAEVTHLQGVSTEHHPFRMIAEHHRSLFRFASRSSTGWRRVLLPVVALGIGVRACLACIARVTRG